MHAWYKGEAVRAYIYLHNYGAGSARRTDLVKSGILTLEEADILNRRHQERFRITTRRRRPPTTNAQTIIDYMKSVRDLHDGLNL